MIKVLRFPISVAVGAGTCEGVRWEDREQGSGLSPGAHLGAVCYLHVSASDLTRYLHGRKENIKKRMTVFCRDRPVGHFSFYFYASFLFCNLSFFLKGQQGSWESQGLQPGHRGGNRVTTALPGRLPARCTSEISPNR